MAKKPTSLNLDESELLDLKTDAESEGMTVTQYMRKLARERKAATPKIPNFVKQVEQQPKVEVKKKMSGELDERAVKAITRETHKEIDMEEKFQETLNKINNTLCVGPDCILERLKKLEPTHKCPKCNSMTLKEGQSKFCPDCGAKITWEE